MSIKPEPSVRDYLFAWGTIPDKSATGCTVEIGYGHWGVFPGREPITDDPWPFSVENCAYAIYAQGYWTRDEKRLFCPGCGLDGT